MTVADHVAVAVTRPNSTRTSVGHWRMGRDTELMRFRYRGVAATTRRRLTADPSTRLITVAVLTPGDWSLTRDHRPINSLPDRPTLVVIDQFSPFDFRGHGDGSVVAVHTRHARLRLSIETIDSAIDHVHPELPLYRLVRGHVQQLGEIAASAPEILPELNSTTIALVRSLLLSAAETAGPATSMQSIVTSIERHIEEHLDDLTLKADTIAAAHNISTRQLYNLWPESNGSLAGYITAQRLARARKTLRTHPHLTVAAVARRHGFSDPTHFTRRFRVAHGVTPSAWRRGAADAGSGIKRTAVSFTVS
ncbi:helix-turn-helix domain-containing protein [Williamsia soli]|uniref:helix-turn-helix domain-containing protein n=1 Tax=Williamsia soli TaxID=364929 RepID=UPI001A9F4A00|nr:helix-turn-helix domain-containing protein [Williamsia soli]